MLGIIIQLALSWLIVWLVQKRNLSVLGFYPAKRRLSDFALFFFVTAFFSATDYFFRMYLGDQRWHLNPNLTGQLILKGFWWNLSSVIYEELIFRGVLLYILVKRLGALPGIIISSVAFGIYHWFSHGVIGNPMQMAITFFTTGIMGLVYAYGYTKTFSLYIPCAIHLGWNLVRSVIFSETVIGDQLLVQVKPVPVVTVSYFIAIVCIFFPMAGAIVADWLLLKKHRQEPDKVVQTPANL